MIHDADCLEIMRCLKSIKDFDYEQLFALKDLGDETVFALIKEAEKLISLTETKEVKALLTDSEEPLKVLFQILDFSFRESGQFSLLNTIHKTAASQFCEGDYLFNQEVEKKILESLESVKK